jgi:hypothetical protein
MLDKPSSAMLGRLRNVSTAARLISAIDDAPSVRAFVPVDLAFATPLTASRVETPEPAESWSRRG